MLCEFPRPCGRSAPRSAPAVDQVAGTMDLLPSPPTDPRVEEHSALDLLLPAEAVGPDKACGQVFELLVRNEAWPGVAVVDKGGAILDRKSTRLNSSH